MAPGSAVDAYLENLPPTGARRSSSCVPRSPAWFPTPSRRSGYGMPTFKLRGRNLLHYRLEGPLQHLPADRFVPRRARRRAGGIPTDEGEPALHARDAAPGGDGGEPSPGAGRRPRGRRSLVSEGVADDVIDVGQPAEPVAAPATVAVDDPVAGGVDPHTSGVAGKLTLARPVEAARRLPVAPVLHRIRDERHRSRSVCAERNLELDATTCGGLHAFPTTYGRNRAVM
jgi:hypothetical protein